MASDSMANRSIRDKVINSMRRMLFQLVTLLFIPNTTVTCAITHTNITLIKLYN